MTRVEIDVPDGALRFLEAMQVLWQHPQGWVQHYLTTSVVKSIEGDMDEGLLIDKEKLKELYGIDRNGVQEIPISPEVFAA